MSDRPKLPYIDLKNWSGLFTKSSSDVLSPEQLRVAENCDFFKSYGAISKLKGSSRVLSSVFTDPSTSNPAKMSWIGFFKSPNLAGAIQRHVLIAAGTTLKRLSGSSLVDIPNTSAGTSSTTGRTSGLFHTADRLDRFMFISNVNPDKVGEGDQLLKYDGAKFSNWGLEPPGNQQTVEEAFDDATDFTTSNCTVADETITTFDGDAIKIDQTGGTIFSLNKSGLNFSAIKEVGSGSQRTSGFISNRLSVYIFIPRGELDGANQSNVDSDSQIPRFFSGAFGVDSSNLWRFDFRKGDFVEGWNKINFDFANGAPTDFDSALGSTPVGLNKGSFDPETTNIDYIEFTFEKESSASNISNIRMDRLQLVDQGAPVVNPVHDGTFSGAYQYKVSFNSKYGNESNTGPSSVSVTASNHGAFYLSFIPTSEDEQVVSRRLYRTVAGGTLFLFVDEIPDNTTTTFVDRIADGSLSEVTAPQAGDFSDDNSPPPNMGIVKRWKKTMFGAGDPQNPQVLYFSDDDEPESWPLINAFDLDDKITAMYETYSGFCVETETGKWQVIGDNPDFAVDKLVENMGCVGRRAAGVSRLVGYSVDREGLRLYDLSDTSKISEPIRDKYDTEIDKANIELIHTSHSRARNNLLQFNPDDTTPIPDYTSIFSYQYAVDDVRTGWWSTINVPSSLNFIHTTEIEDDNGDFHIYAGGDDGMVYEILTTTSNDWTLVDGSTQAVTTKFRSPYLRLGELGAEISGVTGKIQPTYIEVRIEGDTPTTWTATIDLAKGSDQPTPTATQTVDLAFASGQSLLRYPLKFNDMGTREEYVRIEMKNSDSNVESTVKAVRLYFSVKEGQYPVT